MLAVFSKSVAQCPEGLKSPNPESILALQHGYLVKQFSSVHPNAMTVNLGLPGFVAYSNHNHILPRLFAVVDNVFCLFQGHINNLASLKQQYGLSKPDNEVNIIIEAYRSLRDRGPYPIEQVIRDLHGKFTFILYDFASNNTFIAAVSLTFRRSNSRLLSCSIFASLRSSYLLQDPDGSVPFFWGADSEDNLVVSDEVDIVKKGCGKSFAPFPKGCFYTSSGGLRSYEHPRNELKPVPRVDSSGEVCGASFKVDTQSKKEPLGLARVGSAADWSSNY